MKRIILADGCFDVLHPGQVAHLLEARAMGDSLIVALTLDAFVNKGPGRPINTWEDRAAILRELRCVDYVTASENGADAIKRVRPHIYVKGSDYIGKPFPQHVVAACLEVGAEMRHTVAEKKSAMPAFRKIMEFGLA